MPYLNESGVNPIGRRVLVMPDVIEDKVGEIFIPTQEKERHQQAISTGVLVAAGDDVFVHGVEEIERLVNGEMKLVERRTDRRRSVFPEVGTRVVYAKFGGKEIPGIDGKLYRLLNDDDITALADVDVRFGVFSEYRKPVGVQNG